MHTSTNPTNPIESNDHWRPVAYVSMQDRDGRQRIVNVLERAGWAVIPQPSGFHLIQAIAGVVDGRQPWLRPGLIVVDAHSRGCAGTTIAAGLRDLGITIPIVLIAAPGEMLQVTPDRTLRIVDSAAAEKTVAELAAIAMRPIGCRRTFALSSCIQRQRAGADHREEQAAQQLRPVGTRLVEHCPDADLRWRRRQRER